LIGCGVGFTADVVADLSPKDAWVRAARERGFDVITTEDGMRICRFADVEKILAAGTTLDERASELGTWIGSTISLLADGGPANVHPRRKLTKHREELRRTMLPGSPARRP
jgi:hypothetical protein